VTKRELERRSHKQVVLENGRVIAEDSPEVTVDTVEDSQTHEDDGGDTNFARYNGVREGEVLLHARTWETSS